MLHRVGKWAAGWAVGTVAVVVWLHYGGHVDELPMAFVGAGVLVALVLGFAGAVR